MLCNYALHGCMFSWIFVCVYFEHPRVPFSYISPHTTPLPYHLFCILFARKCVNIVFRCTNPLLPDRLHYTSAIPTISLAFCRSLVPHQISPFCCAIFCLPPSSLPKKSEALALFCSFCFYRFSFSPCVHFFLTVFLHLKCYYCWCCCFSESNRYTSIRETTLSLCPRYYSLAVHLRDKPYAIHKQHQQNHVIDTKYHFRLNVLAF